jgi:hypothetical protein
MLTGTWWWGRDAYRHVVVGERCLQARGGGGEGGGGPGPPGAHAVKRRGGKGAQPRSAERTARHLGSPPLEGRGGGGARCGGRGVGKRVRLMERALTDWRRRAIELHGILNTITTAMAEREMRRERQARVRRREHHGGTRSGVTTNHASRLPGTAQGLRAERITIFFARNLELRSNILEGAHQDECNVAKRNIRARFRAEHHTVLAAQALAVSKHLRVSHGIPRRPGHPEADAGDKGHHQ